MKTTHPAETELALLAGGDCGPVSRFFLNRHVRQCRECMTKVRDIETLLVDLAGFDPVLPDWDSLAAEMRANIRLGLEAGECVRDHAEWNGALPSNPDFRGAHGWNPRLAVAFASIVALVAAGLLLHVPSPEPIARQSDEPGFMIESSRDGLELRTGASSITLLNRHGAVADQTVSAQGEIRARYIDGETGTVTINNVSLE
jgi:hypothetical protein